MTATEILEAITAAGGELCRVGDTVSIVAPEPLAPDLLISVQRQKAEILPLLPPSPQSSCEIGSTTVRLSRCSRCSGTNWGPKLNDTEVWTCLDCFHAPLQQVVAPLARPSIGEQNATSDAGFRGSSLASPLPPLTSSRRHHLGEPPPPFACRACGGYIWREALYTWSCNACHHVQTKPEGPWPETLKGVT